MASCIGATHSAISSWTDEVDKAVIVPLVKAVCMSEVTATPLVVVRHKVPLSNTRTGHRKWRGSWLY